jgi:hypothetical protein
VYLASVAGVTAENCRFLPDGQSAVGVPGTSLQFRGVREGVVWHVVVTAIDASGESRESPEATATMRPETPGGVTAFAGIGVMTLAWQTSAVATGYRVYFAADPAVSPQDWAALEDGTRFDVTTSPLVLPTLENGRTYYAVVVAWNATGDSGASSTASGTPSARGTFESGQVIDDVGSPAGGASADFDGDGVIDLAVTNTKASTVDVYRGLGDGTFAPPTSYAVGLDPVAIVAADFDGDGRVDWATADSGSDTASVALGVGGGAFAPVTLYPAGGKPVAIVAATLDAGSTVDLALADYEDDTVTVLLGDGDGSFGAPAAYGTAAGPASLVAARVDGDGVLDLCVAASLDGMVSVLLGLGDGSFGPRSDYSAGVSPVAVVASDFDGDGATDLALVDAVTGNLTVLEATGGGTLVTSLALPGVASTADGVVQGDFDGDGSADLIVANADGTLSVWLGTGFGGFVHFWDVAAGSDPASIQVGDFNGDGTLDLAVTSTADGSIQVFLGATV